MSTKESTIQRRIMLGASSAGYTVWRNNVGVAMHGDPPRPVRYGLCKGSADLIGIRPVTITQDMVGLTLGQFVAFECKTKTGKPTREQKRFLSHVAQCGGLAKIVRSPEDIP